MDELDNILRRLMNKHAEAAPPEGKDCISEERFSAYLANTLGPDERETIEAHLLRCDSCFRKSILFSRILEEMEKAGQHEVPEDLKERAKRLVRRNPSANIAEVILAFGKDVVTIIKDSARICTVPEPVPLSVRSGRKEKRLNPVAYIRTVYDVVAAHVSVEKINDSEFEIEARLTDTASGSPLNDIRVTLLSEGKERASFLSEKGSVLFQKLSFGRYDLEIYKGKQLIGALTLPLNPAS